MPFVLLGCRTKGLLGCQRTVGDEAVAGSSSSSSPRLKFPTVGWKRLADVRSAVEFSLGLSFDRIVAYFVSGRAVDGLQRDDFRNLSGEAFGLYKKKYGREGELCDLDNKLYFRSVMLPTLQVPT